MKALYDYKIKDNVRNILFFWNFGSSYHLKLYENLSEVRAERRSENKCAGKQEVSCNYVPKVDTRSRDNMSSNRWTRLEISFHSHLNFRKPSCVQKGHKGHLTICLYQVMEAKEVRFV